MRVANADLERKILEEALALVIQNGVDNVGMREIAKACTVSPTTLYYYYRDKEDLLEAVKLDCLFSMDSYIAQHVVVTGFPLADLQSGFEAFRDWAFINPDIALLVMNRFKANLGAGAEAMPRYYKSHRLVIDLLEQAVVNGTAASEDPVLDSSVCISAIWGAIESVLTNRTLPKYWDRGPEYTDRAILMCMSFLTKGASV